MDGTIYSYNGWEEDGLCFSSSNGYGNRPKPPNLILCLFHFLLTEKNKV